MEIGRTAELKCVKILSFGAYFDCEGEEVLLPIREVPESLKVDDVIPVFVYKDSLGRPMLSTQKPAFELYGFASLEVSAQTKYGAFLKWGIPNELLLPFSEMKGTVSAGQHVVVRLQFDVLTERLFATMKVDRYLEKKADESVKPGMEAELLVFEETPIGFKTIVNQRFTGMIYKNEIFQEVKKGTALKGYVKQVRPDGKIDLSLREEGLSGIEGSMQLILEELKSKGGFLPLCDGSSPEEIKEAFGISKKTFKRAIGMLYKAGWIEIREDGIAVAKK